MLDDFFSNHVGLGVSLWALVYCSDYILTILAARKYEAGAKKHFLVEGGIELTPYFQNDVARRRWISPRFLLALVFSSTLLGLLGALTKESFHELFAFCLVGYLLLELAVHIRHARNLLLFSYLSRSQGVQGQLTYSRWLTLRVSATELAAFGFAFFLFYLGTGQWAFLGGATLCWVTCLKHLRLSLKAKKASY
jgi:hypothetical protein